jgi:hypothetical protein
MGELFFTIWRATTAWMFPALCCGIFLATGRCLAENTIQATQPTETAPTQFEYNVKAAYLYSFGRYITWPDSAFPIRDSEFVICLLGDDPFGEVLNVIAKTKTIQGHRIVIKKISSIEDLTHCHILFIPRTIKAEQLSPFVNKLQNKSILIVGESPGFIKNGACINFYFEGDQVRFEINSEAIRQEKLQIDAKLLNLGKRAAE